MAHPPIRCTELVEIVTDWMEGVLSDSDRLQVEEHIAICPHCHDYVTQLRLAAETLRQAPRLAPPTPARTALLDAFRRHHDA
jgi:anti-sigma factor RsiW